MSPLGHPSSSGPAQFDQALVLGVTRYQHVRRLPANRDVIGVRDVLADPAVCAYPPERVHVLAEEEATRERILEALDALAGEARGTGVRTFFYFSGHGGRDANGSSYLLPIDARKGNYPSTAISARELSQHLGRCAGQVTAVLDCCFAGGMAEAATGLTAFDDTLHRSIEARGRVVFAASRPDAPSWADRREPYGLFTGHMIEGLRGKACTDGAGVTVQQLFDYVQRRISGERTEEQQRASFIANIEGFYLLTRYPKHIAPNIIFEKDVFIAYDREDPITAAWVEHELTPELEKAGCSLWKHDAYGSTMLDVEAAVTASKYTLAVLTPSYLATRAEDFNRLMAITQAFHTRTPRFIPIMRESCNLPLSVRVFGGPDLSAGNLMQYRRSLEYLLKRLKKEPHVK